MTAHISKSLVPLLSSALEGALGNLDFEIERCSTNTRFPSAFFNMRTGIWGKAACRKNKASSGTSISYEGEIGEIQSLYVGWDEEMEVVKVFPVQLLPISRSIIPLVHSEDGPVVEVEGVPALALFAHPSRFLFLDPFFLNELAPVEFAGGADTTCPSSTPTVPASCWASVSTPTPSPASSSAWTAKAFRVSYNSKREDLRSAVGSAEAPLELVVGDVWALAEAVPWLLGAVV
jgi:hypothetical protein